MPIGFRRRRRPVPPWEREQFLQEQRRRERQLQEFARARKAKGWPT